MFGSNAIATVESVEEGEEEDNASKRGFDPLPSNPIQVRTPHHSLRELLLNPVVNSLGGVSVLNLGDGGGECCTKAKVDCDSDNEELSSSSSSTLSLSPERLDATVLASCFKSPFLLNVALICLGPILV